MKNLKRVLSLALSGIMLVGMMAMSASAVNAEDFTDADEITHTEAVSVSTALKIIDGKEDGSFDPAGNVTRGQMAKMITRAMFGGDDPILGVKATPTFTDIKGRWDESYIEYCANQGIINGRGDGTFDPEGNVTGTEAAKMLLVALGYNVEVYKLTGTDWAINTNSLANGIDAQLYAGLGSIDPNIALNREQTAQMVYNALNAKVVEMRPSTNTNGVIEYQYITQATTMLWRRYGAIRVEGVVTSNEFVDNSESQKGKTYLANTNPDEVGQVVNDGNSYNFSGNFEIPSGKDEFGRAVILYVKPSNSAPKNTLKAEVLCDVILDENTVVSTTKGFGSGKNLTRFAKDKGLKFENTLASNGSPNGVTAQFFSNYDDTYAADGTTALNAAGEIGELDGTTKLPVYTNSIGTEVILIDNDLDGIVDYVLQNEYAFGQVTKYSTKDDGAVSVRTGNTDYNFSNEELKNVVAYDDIEKDDYVNVTRVADTWYLTKAEVITGNLDSYKLASGNIDNVTVDGETYTTSKVTYHQGSKNLDDVSRTNIKTTAIDNEGDFYLDYFGYLVAVDLQAANAFAYIGSASWTDTATSFSPGTLQVYAVLEDGTADTYVVSKYYAATAINTTSEVTINETAFGTASGAPNTALASDGTVTPHYASGMKGKLYKYSLDGEGRIRLTELYNGNAAGGTLTTANDAVVTTAVGDNADNLQYTKGQASFQVAPGATGKTTVDSNTTFFYAFLNKAGTKVESVEVFVGKDNAPSLKGDLPSTVVMNDDATAAAAVLVTTKSVATSNYMYVIKYLYTNNSGDVYQVWMDGEITEITTNGASDTAVARYVGPYTYTTTAKGLYNLKTPDYVMTGYTTLIQGNSMIVQSAANATDTKEFDIKDAEVIYIDGDNSAETTVSKWDTVVVVYDHNVNGLANDAMSVYVVQDYDEGNTSATLNTSATKIRQSEDDNNSYKFDILETATDTDLLNKEITFPYDSQNKAPVKAYFTATKPTGPITADIIGGSGSVTPITGDLGNDGETIYLVVVSEDHLSYGTYKCKLVASF